MLTVEPIAARQDKLLKLLGVKSFATRCRPGLNYLSDAEVCEPGSTRSWFGSSRRMRTLVTQMARLEACPVMRSQRSLISMMARSPHSNQRP